MGSSLATSQPLKRIIDVTSLPFPLPFNAPFLVHLSAPTVYFYLFFLYLLSTWWQRYYETNDKTQMEASQLVVPISKHCSDPLEISLLVWIFLCLEKCTMSH